MVSKKSIYTVTAISVLSILSISFLYSFFYADTTQLPSKETSPCSIKVKQLYIPDSVRLFNEVVPIQNFDTRESLERELLVNVYWQSQTTMFIKMVGRYFPIIEHVLEKNGVPEDFKYVALAESGFRYNISPAGATGYWQFLEKTAKEYGLVVNDYIDERYDIEKSTEAACAYFKKAYERFGSWTLAAASYNVGIAGLSRQISYQYINSYYDLHTNSETGRYVFRILALKLLLENPEKYGYYILPEERYAPYDFVTYTVDSTIPDLAKFAQDNGSNYKLLRIMNPWIRSRSSLPIQKEKPYAIKLVLEKDRTNSW